MDSDPLGNTFPKSSLPVTKLGQNLPYIFVYLKIPEMQVLKIVVS